VTPWPLARWLAPGGPDAPGPAEVAAGAGAASSGGLALKLGALLASGAFLTGAVHLRAPSPHRGSVRAAVSAHGRGAVARARPVTVASVAPPLFARAGSPAGPHAIAVPGGGRVTRAGTAQEIVRHLRRDAGRTGSALRSEGFPAAGHRDGRGDRTDRGGSTGSGHRDGGGASSLPSSGTRTGSDGP